MPRMMAMAIVRATSGRRSPWGRFRVAVERFDAVLFELLARRARGQPRGDSMLEPAARAARRGRQPAERPSPPRPARGAAGRRPRQLGRVACVGVRAAGPPPGRAARLRDGDPAYLDAVVKEVLRVRPALTIAPRLLLEPVRIAGHGFPRACRSPRACGWRCAARTCGRRASRSGPSAGSRARRRTRSRGSRTGAACAAARAPRSRRWRCVRCCGRPRG